LPRLPKFPNDLAMILMVVVEPLSTRERTLTTDHMLAAIATSLMLTTLTKPVTALSTYAGDVYAGYADGSVERVNADQQVETIYSKPQGARVSFITASTYGVAWLSGPGGAIREKVAAAKPAAQTLTIRGDDHTYTVTIQPASPIRRLAWLCGRVAVSYDFGSGFYDLKGHAVDASTFMSSDAATLAKDGSLWVREQEDGTELALFAKPYAVRQDPRNQKAPLVSMFTAYQVGAWQWVKLGGFASNAFDAFPDGELKATEEGRLAADTKFMVLSDRVGLAQDGIVAREPESLANVPIFARDWEIARIDAASVPGDALWFGAAGDNAWWWNGLALVQQNRRSGQFAVYLPWADSGLTPQCFAADGNGIWVGSNHGLRFLDASKPDPKLGYAGFVRAPFGVEATSSIDPNAKKLTDAVFAWRFAQADTAGTDGGLMVASIYSSLGVPVPTTAPELSNAGTVVSEDLKFGDVVLTPKSAAIYLGNGITVEVRGGRVQNGELWAFPKATVRRFVPQ
jgi:hypothetical protein